MFVRYNHKTKYTDVPYQMTVDGAFVCVDENIFIYLFFLTVYITHFFLVEPTTAL